MAGVAKKINLTADERERLEALASSRTVAVAVHDRAKMLLLKASGRTNAEVADKMDVHPNTVTLLLRKFREGGVDAALADAPGRGRPAEIGEADELWAVEKACVPPRDCGHAAELWYPALLTRHIRSVAEAEGHPRMATVSETKLRKILRDAKVQPWRVTYYCERRDEEFDAKAHDVLVVYRQLSLCFDEAGEVWAECVDAEGRAARAVSVDEKPGTRAIAPTGEDRPPAAGGDAKGRPATVQRDHEHGRLGTWSLIAGIDLTEGVAHPLVRESHRSSDFADFLKVLDAHYPRRDSIRPMLDNHSARTSAETQAYLNTVPGRFTFVFVPRHASWMNLIESFFGRMSRQMLRGIRVSTKEELRDRIYAWFEEFNEDPSPYRWTWGVDGIDMEDERPESIGYQVVNAKACRSEDMGKPAPPRPRPKPGRAAIKNLRQARAPETQERTKEDPVIVYGFICRRLY